MRSASWRFKLIKINVFNISWDDEKSWGKWERRKIIKSSTSTIFSKLQVVDKSAKEIAEFFIFWAFPLLLGWSFPVRRRRKLFATGKNCQKENGRPKINKFSLLKVLLWFLINFCGHNLFFHVHVNIKFWGSFQHRHYNMR